MFSYIPWMPSRRSFVTHSGWTNVRLYSLSVPGLVKWSAPVYVP
jgi:hypothetical protein